MSSDESTAKVVHAEPTKDFFVRMITRDIALEDCILDLLDNAIDGARRTSERALPGKPFEGYFANIKFDDSKFLMSDNCGGIRLTDAIDYAFHFGRKPGSPADVAGGIGLYGIGMKRAIFKLGRLAEVRSEADDACFTVSVDVAAWEASSVWDFDYSDAERKGVRGTQVEVAQLYEGISSSLADPVFKNELIKLIARDYAFFIDKGFRVTVQGTEVPAYSYQLRTNAELEPAFEQYSDGEVTVKIVAGLVDALADDIPEELTPDQVDRYGWFVVCNDRIVLAADKSDSTVWGDDGFRVWHPQYNGFAGFVFFQAENQAALPWTTTKREIDRSSAVYRRAIRKMKSVTDDFVKYTGKRKLDLDVAREAEVSVAKVDVHSVDKPQRLKLPTLRVAATERVDFANVAYRRPVSEMHEIRSHLGDGTMTYREIGVYTFEYFLRMELGK